MRRATRLGILTAASAALIAPASASADKLVLGPSALNSLDVGSVNHCNSPCTETNLTMEPQFGTLTAPNDATITSWSLRTQDNGVGYHLRVMRNVGGSFLAKATTTQLIASNQAVDTTYTSGPVSIPISAGDQLGLQTLGPGNQEPAFPAGAMTPNFIRYFSLPDIADGATLAGTQIDPWVIPVQAQLSFCKVPTVTGQTEAAARAAITAADCAHGTVTKQRLQLLALKRIPKGASKKKKKKISAQNAAIEAQNATLRAQNGIVLTQGTAPGTVHGSPPGPGVALTVGETVEPPAPPKKKKKKKKK